MNFLVDTQLPPALARWLSSQGHPAPHTTHSPNGHLLKDREILNLAVNEQRGIVTKDHDFLDNFLLHGIPPLVSLLEYGNISNRDLLQLVASQGSKIESAFQNGANFVKASRASLTVWS